MWPAELRSLLYWDSDRWSDLLRDSKMAFISHCREEVESLGRVL